MDRRILFVSNMFPSAEHPYKGVFVRNTLQILEEEGINVTRVFLAGKRRRLLHILSYIPYTLRVILHLALGPFQLAYIHYAGFNSIGVLIGAMFNRTVDIVTNIHGSDVFPGGGRLEKWLTRQLLQRSSVVVSPSRAYAEILANDYGVDRTRIVVFPSGGIDTSRFKPPDDVRQIRREMAIPADQFVLGFVGSIEPAKGWKVLLHALKDLTERAILSKFLLVVAGDGSERETFYETSKSLSLMNNIMFLGSVQPEMLPRIYGCLDVVLIPTFRESLGLAGLEAMACGVPVIASKVGGLMDYVEDGENGYFFPPGEVVALSARIEEFIHLTQENRDRLRRHALATASRYATSRVRPILVDLFPSSLQS